MSNDGCFFKISMWSEAVGLGDVEICEGQWIVGNHGKSSADVGRVAGTPSRSPCELRQKTC